MLSKLAQHGHVFGVAQAAFDQPDVARTHVLDVGQGRAVETDVFHQLEQPLVDVQERHVAAEATGQRDRGHAQLGRCQQRGVHDGVSGVS
jgi:hypothetical protein